MQLLTKQIPLDIGLKQRPQLDAWVAGPNVQLLAHMQQVVADPLQHTTPTYIWGAPGSGRTYLLQAVMQELQNQGLSVGWLDANTVCADMPLPFDERWSAVVLDDVDRYNVAQQHTAFNWFVHAKAPADGQVRWVVAAGAMPVTDLPLREDLRTRLGWGQSYAIHPLREEDVRQALRQAAHARGLELHDDVLNYMLTRFSRDLGNLSRLLDRLDNYSLETRRALTVPLLKQMLNE